MSTAKLYPKRLHHDLPLWVNPSGAIFHIRIRTANESPVPMTDQSLAPKLLDSVVEYVRRQIWWPSLFPIMPDHIHALFSFDPTRRMSRVVGDWKKWNHQNHGVLWQDNFFDHRLRRDEPLEEKATYIRRNPVVKGLCSSPEEWPWVLDSELIRKALGR
jgi:putative transposase